MHTENLVLYQSSNWKSFKNLGKPLPEFDGVSFLALVVEPVESIDGLALVISSQEKEVLGVADFVGQEQDYGFYVLVSSVDVVSEEEVVLLGRIARKLENAQKVVELPVNVTTNLEGPL